MDQLYHLSTEKKHFNLIIALLKHIFNTKPPGSILIFLPEITDVLKLHEILEEKQGKYHLKNSAI